MPSPLWPQAEHKEHSMAAGLTLAYAGEDAARALLAAPEHVLGVIGFGVARPEALPADWPYLTAPLSPTAGTPQYEIWTTATPVTPLRIGPVAGACSKDLAFGCIRLETTPGLALEDAAEQAYLAIFDFLAQSGFTEPVRFWNYLTAILEDDNGLERYRRFNIGRHRAFLARLKQTVPPAASCVGGHGEDSIIYFLASRTAAQPVENPRQVSAYDYPPQYGPRSPSFSRAGLFGGRLFISGTASITGHESRHIGDVMAQARETLTNLRALTEAAGLNASFAQSDGWAFKIYLRDQADQTLVAPLLDEAFGPGAQKLYLHSEVCRSELLLEIEAYYHGL